MCEKMILRASFALFMSIFATHLFAETQMQIECQDRIRELDKNLRQVLNSRKYSMHKRKALKAARTNAGLNSKSYSESIEELKMLIKTDNKGRIADGNELECLLKTGPLIQKLDFIASKGGKTLNDFSKSWQKAFPNHAKRLGY